MLRHLYHYSISFKKNSYHVGLPFEPVYCPELHDANMQWQKSQKPDISQRQTWQLWIEIIIAGLCIMSRVKAGMQFRRWLCICFFYGYNYISEIKRPKCFSVQRGTHSVGGGLVRAHTTDRRRFFPCQPCPVRLLLSASEIPRERRAAVGLRPLNLDNRAKQV